MSVLKCFYDTVVSLGTTKEDRVVHSTIWWSQVATLKNKQTLIQWAPFSLFRMTVNTSASRSASLVFLLDYLYLLLIHRQGDSDAQSRQ